MQTKPNVTFLFLQQNFQLKFSFKSYFFFKKKKNITRLISTAAAIPKPFTNETEKSTKLQMVTQWLQRWHKEWPWSLRWLTVLHSRWRPAAFPATGACTLRKWELYTIMLEEWHQNMMYSNGIRFSSAFFLKTLHCITHIKYLLMPGRKVSETSCSNIKSKGKTSSSQTAVERTPMKRCWCYMFWPTGEAGFLIFIQWLTPELV